MSCNVLIPCDFCPQVRFISHLLDKHSTSLAKIPEVQTVARTLRSFVASSSSNNAGSALAAALSNREAQQADACKGDDRGAVVGVILPGESGGVNGNDSSNCNGMGAGAAAGGGGLGGAHQWTVASDTDCGEGSRPDVAAGMRDVVH